MTFASSLTEFCDSLMKSAQITFIFTAMLMIIGIRRYWVSGIIKWLMVNGYY